MLIYSDTAERGNYKGISIKRMNATRQYLNHYDNKLYLSFIANKSDNFVERTQANNELIICERKLNYWMRQEGFDMSEATIGTQALKNKWQAA